MAEPQRLPKTVIGLGFVSLFTDLASEAIYPLLPALLVSLGASRAFIGVVDGVANLVANLLKYVSGAWGDRLTRLKPLVFLGYCISTAVRPLMAFAGAPWHVLALRSGDRVGKGIRTSPRDALVARVTDETIRGRAFGFHRAMDHGGAALGSLLGAGLLALGLDMRAVFLWTIVPGGFAVLALALTPEPPVAAPVPAEKAKPEPLTPELKRLLVALTLFALASASEAFLLVKLKDVGAPDPLLPLLWLVLHVVKSSLSTPMGTLADRFGRRGALLTGWALFAATWGSLGFATTVAAVFAITAVYGVSIALTEGAERALVAQVSSGRKGKAFGAYHLTLGVAQLGASAAFGWVWDHYGGAVAFPMSGGIALVACGALVLVSKGPRLA